MEYAVIKVVGNHGGSECGLRCYATVAISTEKSVLASSADILGYHVDCLTATIQPKYRAIDKLFYVLFSFSCSDRQPLVLWQCLSSLVNMYSHVIRGMHHFVAPIIYMTCRASGHHTQRAHASVCFGCVRYRNVASGSGSISH